MKIKLFAIILFFAVTAFVQPISATVPDAQNQNPILYHSKIIAFGAPDDAERSLQWMLRRGNVDVAAHLITAMRYSSLGRDALSEALTVLTQESLALTWFDWMIWQEENPQVKPHSSIVELKSFAFNAIDPNFERFYSPDVQFDIRPEEVVWGGVRVDGIPALDNPIHITAQKADYLRDDDEVFGVFINGEARAYPLRIMGWHEMFNDVVGGVPVSLAYCTLCNAGILFEGDYNEREKFGVTEPFTFGSSGFLYRSNKLMYDRQTDSLWNQYTGRPVAGKLLNSGIELKIRPVVITSWEEWKKEHPKTKVLSLDTGFKRNYGSGVVYNEYFASPDLMFPARGDISASLKEKQQIFGVRYGGASRAWPLEAFTGGTVINDAIGVTNVVLIGDYETRTVRAYERKEHMFNEKLITTDGQTWGFSEDGLRGENGAWLKRLPGHVSYWFAWVGYLGDEGTLYKVKP